jgi:cold-inducible RNA-binding protein
MAKKLYVGNLSYATSEDQLHGLFSEIGPVESAALIIDRQTGQSKGFAFIEMQSAADAQTAIDRLNNREVDGRSLTVNEAKPPRQQDAGGGNRSRGRDSRPQDRRRSY